MIEISLVGTKKMNRKELIKIIEKEAGYDELQLTLTSYLSLFIYRPGLTIIVNGAGRAFTVQTLEAAGMTWYLVQKQEFLCYQVEPRRAPTLWEEVQTYCREKFGRWLTSRRQVTRRHNFKTFQRVPVNSRGIFK